MSEVKWKNCGSTDIEVDNAREDAVCTNCGIVLEDNLIVSEIQFEEVGHGSAAMVGQFVAGDYSGGAINYGYGKFKVGSGNESREITIKKAKKEITHLCHQLQLIQHYIDTSLNFFRMALMRHLTRGRRSTHKQSMAKLFTHHDSYFLNSIHYTYVNNSAIVQWMCK